MGEGPRAWRLLGSQRGARILTRPAGLLRVRVDDPQGIRPQIHAQVPLVDW